MSALHLWTQPGEGLWAEPVWRVADNPRVAVKKPKFDAGVAGERVIGRARFLRSEGSALNPRPRKGKSFDSRGEAGEPGTRALAALQRKRRPAPWR